MPFSTETHTSSPELLAIDHAGVSREWDASNPPALRPRNILVPFDFSQMSFELLRQSTNMATSFGATLHVLHVTEPSERALDDKSPVVPTNAEPLLRYWTNIIVGDRVPCVPWIRDGASIDEIVVMSRTLDIDLVVMASRSFARLKEVFERSSADYVSRISPCPVLTLSERAISRPWNSESPFASCRRILLPLVAASSPHQAIRHATMIARASGGTVTVVNVSSEQGESGPACGEANNTGNAGALARKAGSNLGVPVSFQSLQWHGTSPVYPILLATKRSKADLIVLPIRHAAWSRRQQLASITDSILRHAPCPVLSVNETIRDAAAS